MSEQLSLKSSVEKKGKTVTQIITMLGGYKKTFRDIKTETIEQGEFVHFDTLDGRTILVNTKNVLFVEVFGE